MTLQILWLGGIRAWADQNFSIKQLWLLGNFSEVDDLGDGSIDMIAILSPPDESTYWAFFKFVNKQDEWAREISAIVGHYVNMEALKSGSKSEEFIGTNGWCFGRAAEAGRVAAPPPGSQTASHGGPEALIRSHGAGGLVGSAAARARCDLAR